MEAIGRLRQGILDQPLDLWYATIRAYHDVYHDVYHTSQCSWQDSLSISAQPTRLAPPSKRIREVSNDVLTCHR